MKVNQEVLKGTAVLCLTSAVYCTSERCHSCSANPKLKHERAI